MLAAYYATLHDDPDFQAELRQLAAHVGDAAHHSCIEGNSRVQAFAVRWHLPRNNRDFTTDGLHHLDWSLAMGEDPPRLHADTGMTPMTRTFGRWITPDVPSFRYDPTDGGGTAWVRKWANDLADQAHDRVYKSIMEQVKMAEAEARTLGWRPAAPRYGKPGELERLARRLYRRVVLGWTYDRIADQEYLDHASDGDDNPDAKIAGADAIRRSVGDWATRLHIPLADPADNEP